MTVAKVYNREKHTHKKKKNRGKAEKFKPPVKRQELAYNFLIHAEILRCKALSI